jgi:hypothetical protein
LLRYDYRARFAASHEHGHPFLKSTTEWDGIEVPMQTANSNLMDFDKIISTNKNIDVFVIALSTMKILNANMKGKI